MAINPTISQILVCTTTGRMICKIKIKLTKTTVASRNLRGMFLGSAISIFLAKIAQFFFKLIRNNNPRISVLFFRENQRKYSFTSSVLNLDALEMINYQTQ